MKRLIVVCTLVFCLVYGSVAAHEDFVKVDVRGKLMGYFQRNDMSGFPWLIIKIVSNGETYHAAVLDTAVGNEILRSGKLIRGNPIEIYGLKQEKDFENDGVVEKMSIIVPLENQRFVTFPEPAENQGR